MNEHSFSDARAEEFKVKAHNALRSSGGCEYLILIGLSEDQKSYLDFLDQYNVIEIDKINDPDIQLKEIVNKTDYLSCNSNDIYNGLNHCLKNNLLLRLSDSEPKLVLRESDSEGLIVVEYDDSASLVVAICYARSENADVEIISASEDEREEILELVVDWKEGSDDSHKEIKALLYDRLSIIPFTKYKFATFFTIGIPYSLVLDNVIPITYVHLRLSPDFFIFRNLEYEKRARLNSAVVFSPLKFENEETAFVIDCLERHALFVKGLIGKAATGSELDCHVRDYPYDLLHLCSHSELPTGWLYTEDFTDRDGQNHTVEFVEVVGFAPDRQEKDVKVTRLIIPKKFDGYLWRSEELDAQHFNKHVFSDMYNELLSRKRGEGRQKVTVREIPSIQCSDFTYFGKFNQLAAQCTSPFIFNNTCQSWLKISDNFIDVGCRAYIGTLWNINNSVAKQAATAFYNDVFSSTILESFTKALQETRGTKDEGVYIIWGLHFSTIKSGQSKAKSKRRVASYLLDSYYSWINHVKKISNQKIKTEIARRIRWTKFQMDHFFGDEIIQIICEKMAQRRKK